MVMITLGSWLTSESDFRVSNAHLYELIREKGVRVFVMLYQLLYVYYSKQH